MSAYCLVLNAQDGSGQGDHQFSFKCEFWTLLPLPWCLSLDPSIMGNLQNNAGETEE